MENMKMRGKNVEGLLPQTPVLFHLSYPSGLNKLTELTSLLAIAGMVIRRISS